MEPQHGSESLEGRFKAVSSGGEGARPALGFTSFRPPGDAHAGVGAHCLGTIAVEIKAVL